MRIFFIVLLGIGFSSYAQNPNIPQENGTIFKLYDGSTLLGKLVSYNESPYLVKIITGDTITIDPLITKRIYLPEEINLYGKGKYSRKKGLVASAVMGLSPEHYNFDFQGSYMFRNKFAFGAGFGFHSNFFSIRTISSSHQGQVMSRTYFLNAQYYFTDKSRRIYATGRVGFADHKRTRELPIISDGVVLEGGIGILLSSRNMTKYFFEISQYTTNAKGSLVSNDVNALSDIEFDIWFNRIVFTVGVQLGK